MLASYIFCFSFGRHTVKTFGEVTGVNLSGAYMLIMICATVNSVSAHMPIVDWRLVDDDTPGILKKKKYLHKILWTYKLEFSSCFYV